MLRRAVKNQAIHGICISAEAPPISHLLFADDSIFFVRATIQEADVVNDILRKYEAASGQLVSLEKTTVVFSRGVIRGQRDAVSARLGVEEVREHARYLGLPTVVGRSKKVITDIIRDKLSKRLQGWREKILSRAGKEVLIKAVANSLTTYVMSVFKIPANFCDELRAIVARFWWGHDESKRGIHWVSWRKMARPKGEGGLGFRDFRQFNLALLGKQAWRLLTNPTSLWSRLMKVRYFPDNDFMTARVGYNPSYTWRGILEAREVMRVLDVRISPNKPLDIWYWGLEKDGLYTVRSAYKMLVGKLGDMAEATAIMDGLEEAAARGIRKVEMESDCLPVIEAIRDKQLGRSMFHQLLDDIVKFSLQFESVIWSYVSRVNNCVAHGLAHCIPRAVGKVVLEDGLPPSVNTAVAFDRLLIE
ncbi:uncharacterized protein LOC141639525 [Silene latifolia]|uniref:uncharacterized protein LOC141639525 n=1 Tax=Silene latifolia TaxID=37657 RepID=UPI003D780521